MDSLVSTGWLAAELGAPDLQVIDATMFLPGSGRNARAEYEAEHIPGAVFMDLDEIVDRSNPLPHMLPPDHEFAGWMQSAGLGDGQRFVVYDNSPLHSSARAWWMLRSFGAHFAAILDGGLQKWKAEGRPLEADEPKARQVHFTPRLDRAAIADRQFVKDAIGSPGHQIVDARSAARFAGEEAEPRPGLASGHIPGSRSLPQSELFNSDNCYKKGQDLKAAFDSAGVDLSLPLITTCGSGVTAAVLLFGAHLLGKEDVKLYDGSWAEWGADPSLPKETGRT